MRALVAFTVAIALHVALLRFAPPAQARQAQVRVAMNIRQTAAKPEPVVQPAAAPKVARRAHGPVAPKQAVVQAPVTVESPSAPALVQGDATPVATPAVVAPAAPTVVATQGGGAGDDDAVGEDPNALANYRGSLHTLVAGMKRYPLQARRMHIEGVTTVAFRLDRNGQLVCPPRVVTSSHPLLDAEAMRMVQAAAPFPPRPRGVKDNDEIRISINFTLSS